MVTAETRQNVLKPGTVIIWGQLPVATAETRHIFIKLGTVIIWGQISVIPGPISLLFMQFLVVGDNDIFGGGGGVTRVLSRSYLLGKKSQVAEGHEFPRRPRGIPPRYNFFLMNMRWGAIWCILIHNFEKCSSVCTDLVASRWFFRYSYLYTVMITTFLEGNLGILGGKLLSLKYPR